MTYESLHTLTKLPSHLSRLLGEVSYESAKLYREGGRGRENVLTFEVLQALDFLPRDPFLSGVLAEAVGGEVLTMLRTEVEALRLALLPGDMFLSRKPGAEFWVQPDGVFQTDSVFGLLEVKRIRPGSFQREQLAREFALVWQEARRRKKIPLLLLVLPKAPPVKLKGQSTPLHISDAITLSLEKVLARCEEPFPSAKELLSEVNDTVAYVTWDQLKQSVINSAANYTSADSSTAASVSRIMDSLLQAIEWHGKPVPKQVFPHEFAPPPCPGEVLRGVKMEDFPNRTMVRGFGGGAVYTAERNGRLFVLTNESATLDALSEEDAEGLEPVTAYAFNSDAERWAFLASREWGPRE